MAETIGDDERFARNMAAARAALGRAQGRPRPVAVPDLVPDAEDPDGTDGDERDERIARLEAEIRRLRATLARIHEESDRALDR